MPKLIVVTCLMLFWAFYEASGGADFVPHERAVLLVKAKAEIVTEEEPVITEVTAVRSVPVVEDAVESAPRANYRIEPVLIAAATPQPEPAVRQPGASQGEVVQVAGEWVNMRDGPSTDFGVLDTLPRGTRAEIMDRDGAGWAQIRIVESGQIGWMAERLLTDG